MLFCLSLGPFSLEYRGLTAKKHVDPVRNERKENGKMPGRFNHELTIFGWGQPLPGPNAQRR